MDLAQKTIMTEFGFDKLPEDQQADLYQRIGTVLFQAVMLRALDELNEQEQNALDAFVGEHPDDPEALMGYLREHVAGFDELVADEVARFRASALDLMKPVA